MEAGPIVAIVGTTITVISLLVGIVWRLAAMSTTLTTFIESMKATIERAEKDRESAWTEINHGKERDADTRSRLARIETALRIRGDDKRE